MPICKGARLKIKRANMHIAELESCISGLKERLAVSAHINTSSGCEYIECAFAELDDREAREELAGIIGDAIHNLKCALDHVWLETVCRLIPNGDWRRAKFPAYPTANNLETALRKLKIDLATPNFFNFLLGDVKPYRGGNFAIWPVHKLDIRDKHRLLIPVIHYSSIGDIELEDQNGETHRGSTAPASFMPQFAEFKRGLHIRNPGSATFEVMFEDEDLADETEALTTLGFYTEDVLKIVELLEQFVEP